MKALLYKLYHNSIIRYLFFGGITVLVNLVTYWSCRNILTLHVNSANIISIIVAVLFAFFTNSKYVFTSSEKGMDYLKEFGKFISARAVTMVIEVFGVILLMKLFQDDMIAKFLTQFIVIILNYVLSRFLVFKK